MVSIASPSLPSFLLHQTILGTCASKCFLLFSSILSSKSVVKENGAMPGGGGGFLKCKELLFFKAAGGRNVPFLLRDQSRLWMLARPTAVLCPPQSQAGSLLTMSVSEGGGRGKKEHSNYVLKRLLCQGRSLRG